MKNIFNPEDYTEIIGRIEALSPQSTRQWGTMTAPQMLVHCRKVAEAAVGEFKLRSSFLLRLFGRFIKKKMFAAPRFAKNAPTAPQYKVNAPVEDFETERRRLLEIISRFQKGPQSIPDKKHPVFGPLTDEEWGRLHYMHLDHHLRQFSV